MDKIMASEVGKKAYADFFRRFAGLTLAQIEERFGDTYLASEISSQHMRPQDEELSSLCDEVEKLDKKIRICNQLQNTLQCPGYEHRVGVEERLADFISYFKSNREALESRRDSGWVTFLKVVGTIFSLGLAAPILWRVEGAKTAKRFDQALADNDNLTNKP